MMCLINPRYLGETALSQSDLFSHRTGVGMFGLLASFNACFLYKIRTSMIGNIAQFC